jgi:hypothetical protein
VHYNKPRLPRGSRSQPEGAVLQVKRQAVDVLAAVESPPVLKANSHVVEKAARRLRNRPERPSDDNKKVKEEGRYVLVLQRSSSEASLSASVVYSVSPLEHINSLAAVKRGALGSRDKVLRCSVVSRCSRLYNTPTHL